MLQWDLSNRRADRCQVARRHRGRGAVRTMRDHHHFSSSFFFWGGGAKVLNEVTHGLSTPSDLNPLPTSWSLLSPQLTLNCFFSFFLFFFWGSPVPLCFFGGAGTKLCAGFGVVRIFLFNVTGQKPATLSVKTRCLSRVEVSVSGLFWGLGIRF